MHRQEIDLCVKKSYVNRILVNKLHLKLDTMKLEWNIQISTRCFGLHLAKRIMRKVFMFHYQR